MTDPQRSNIAFMRVADGIEQVEGLGVGNAYVVVIDSGLLVVDTSMFGGCSKIVAAVGRLGGQPGDVKQIVLTHWHPDHIGHVAELHRLTGAPVAIHELDAPALVERELPAKGRRAMGLLFSLLRIKPVQADVVLRSGDSVGGFEVIHVPGHTAGSIALRRSDGVVLSGDALLGDRHGRMRQPDPGLSLDPAQAKESAELIRELKPGLLLPGHGRPVPA